MTSEDIDELLERYLGLLDEYTKLRTTLDDLQRGVYQDLARANFAAERGIRYGRDFYDGRMQSTRGVLITNNDDGGDSGGSLPKFEIVRTRRSPEPEDEGSDEGGGDDDKDGSAAKEGKTFKKANDDPLRWFGLLTPAPLRQAQGRAVQAVEEVIPRLVSVDAEMAAVEIRVRRARKRRAKAEAAAEKEKKKEEGDGKTHNPELAGRQETEEVGA